MITIFAKISILDVRLDSEYIKEFKQKEFNGLSNTLLKAQFQMFGKNLNTPQYFQGSEVSHFILTVFLWTLI